MWDAPTSRHFEIMITLTYCVVKNQTVIKRNKILLDAVFKQNGSSINRRILHVWQEKQEQYVRIHFGTSIKNNNDIGVW